MFAVASVVQDYRASVTNTPRKRGRLRLSYPMTIPGSPHFGIRPPTTSGKPGFVGVISRAVWSRVKMTRTTPKVIEITLRFLSAVSW